MKEGIGRIDLSDLNATHYKNMTPIRAQEEIMINLKFKSYDSGFVRAYFKHNKTLYCVQAGFNYLPELMICSGDGEPSHPVADSTQYSFTNLPPDGNTWSWTEIIAFFTCKEITSNGQLIKRMNDLFEVNE